MKNFLRKILPKPTTIIPRGTHLPPESCRPAPTRPPPKPVDYMQYENILRGNTTKWEWIARRMAILAKHEIAMCDFIDHIDDPDFLSNKFLRKYYRRPFSDKIQKELDKIK